MADRIHNARTFRSGRRRRRRRMETLETTRRWLTARYEHGRGNSRSFKTLYPEIYEEIDRLVASSGPQRKAPRVTSSTRRGRPAPLGYEGHGRTPERSHYSIYQKMIVRVFSTRPDPVAACAGGPRYGVLKPCTVGGTRHIADACSTLPVAAPRTVNWWRSRSARMRPNATSGTDRMSSEVQNGCAPAA